MGGRNAISNVANNGDVKGRRCTTLKNRIISSYHHQNLDEIKKNQRKKKFSNMNHYINTLSSQTYHTPYITTTQVHEEFNQTLTYFIYIIYFFIIKLCNSFVCTVLPSVAV